MAKTQTPAPVQDLYMGESQTQLIDQLVRLCDAGISLVQIRTREVARTLETLRMNLSADANNVYREFDITFGNRINYSATNYNEHSIPGDNATGALLQAMRYALDELNKTDGILRDPTKFLYHVFNVPLALVNSNPAIIELLRVYSTILPISNACIIFVTADETINVPLGTIHSIDAPTPSEEELRLILTDTLESQEAQYQDGFDFEEESYDTIARLGKGMTANEFSNAICITLVDCPPQDYDCLGEDVFIEGISKTKTEVVKQSEILEMFHPEDMDNVAGMAGLKHWIANRKNSFSQAAIDFGIEPPKAVALVGVPGTGKSLAAKAIAHEWSVPLLRLDFGKVFGKWVGESEARMRTALNMVASMGHLVLMVDEIDKALGGIGGGGTDSGTSSRVLGAFLTWMQENKSGCLVVVTANDITGLPPELFRKGRMDQIFSVGLPDEKQRREVLAVHLRKRKRSIDDFNDTELRSFLNASDQFVPAEIEQAVKDALVLAFNEAEEEPKLEMRHILTALSNSVPMARSHAERIAAITEWANTHAVSVEDVPDASKALPSSVTTIGSRSPRRRPGPQGTTH